MLRRDTELNKLSHRILAFDRHHHLQPHGSVSADVRIGRQRSESHSQCSGTLPCTRRVCFGQSFSGDAKLIGARILRPHVLAHFSFEPYHTASFRIITLKTPLFKCEYYMESWEWVNREKSPQFLILRTEMPTIHCIRDETIPNLDDTNIEPSL